MSEVAYTDGIATLYRGDCRAVLPGQKWEHGHLSGRNRRTVWTIATQPYPDAHFATFPEALVEPCILAGCPVQGVVLDPFAGSGTTLAVAKRLDRRAIGIELSAEYATLVADRCRGAAAQIAIPMSNPPSRGPGSTRQSPPTRLEPGPL